MDPNFDGMSIDELEKFIQANGQEVDRIRAVNLKAHDVLLAKVAEQERAIRANRPADFPPAQGVGSVN